MVGKSKIITIKCLDREIVTKSTSLFNVSEETPDWERELQQELQEYEVVTDTDNRDDNWDKEIEEMLQADE